MPNQKNIDQLKSLQEKLAKTKSAVLTDYCGLTVNQITQLRKAVNAVGGELKIAKNTLLKIALKKSWQADDQSLEFKEPTAILFTYKDEIAPLKTLYDFSKKNPLLKIKFGFLNKKLLTAEKIISFAKLPAKPQLQAQLVSALSFHLRGLVYVLQANLNSLTKVIQRIKERKENGGESK